MEANDRLLGRAPRGQGQKHREGGRGRAWSSRPVQSSQVAGLCPDYPYYPCTCVHLFCACARQRAVHPQRATASRFIAWGFPYGRLSPSHAPSPSVACALVLRLAASLTLRARSSRTACCRPPTSTPSLSEVPTAPVADDTIEHDKYPPLPPFDWIRLVPHPSIEHAGVANPNRVLKLLGVILAIPHCHAASSEAGLGRQAEYEGTVNVGTIDMAR
eukprot:scaffold21404_cov32-Tisochrysis_lutea.AAC.4